MSEFFATNAPDRPHWIPNSCFVAFHTIWVHLGPFGCLYETRCKTGRTSAKLRATKSFRNFSQRTHPIHPIGPKLTYWCVLFYLGAIGTVLLPYETRCKTGGTSAKVRATKSRRIFSQRTHPIHPIGPEADILVCFVLFGCTRDRLVALRNSVQNMMN